jgi:hypothetical protein
MDHITSLELQVSNIKNPVAEHHLTNAGRSALPREIAKRYLTGGLNRLYTKNYRLTTNGPKLSTILDLFMQNKANFKKVKFDITNEMKKNYEKRTLVPVGKTKPNKANSKPIQSQFEKCQNERN